MQRSREKQKVRGGARTARVVARTALVLALSFLAAEATVRFAAGRIPGVRTLAQPAGTRVRDPESFAEFQQAYRDHLVPYRELYGFRCNSLGFHDLEFQRPMPPGGMRIVALGDSFAFGTVPYGHLYLTLTEALLLLARARGGVAAPLEIDNLGVPASGIADYRLVYALVGRDLAPDLVLVTLYLGNDPRDYADAARFGGARIWPDSWLVTFLRRAAKLARERARRPPDGVAAPPGPASGVFQPHRRYSDESPEFRRPVFSDEAIAEILRGELSVLVREGAPLERPDWPAFDAALEDLVREIRRDAPVVLVLAPSRLQVYPAELGAAAARAGVPPDEVDADLPNRRVARLARALDVPLIDTTPMLRRRAESGERLYLPNDTHWNLHGNAVVAEEVARRLVALGFVAIATEKAPHAADRSLPGTRRSG